MKKNELEHYEARIENLEIENQELQHELQKVLIENEALWTLLFAVKTREDDRNE